MKLTAGLPFVAIIAGASADRAGYGSENDESVTGDVRPAGYLDAQSLYRTSSTPSPLPPQSSTGPSELVDYYNNLVAISGILTSPVFNSSSSANSDAQTSVLVSSSTIPSVYWPIHASSPLASTTANPLAGGKYYYQHYRHGKGDSNIIAPVTTSASSLIKYHPVAYNSVPSPTCDADAPASSPVSPIIAASSAPYEPVIVSSYILVSCATSFTTPESEVASSASIRAYGGYVCRDYDEGDGLSSTTSSAAASSSDVANPTVHGRYNASRPSTRVKANRQSSTTLTHVRTHSDPSQVFPSSLAVSSQVTSSSSVLASPFGPVKIDNGIYGRHAVELKVSPASYIIHTAPTRTRTNIEITGRFGHPAAQSPDHENQGSDGEGSKVELEVEANTHSGLRND
jgi:hypothetical protein